MSIPPWMLTSHSPANATPPRRAPPLRYVGITGYWIQGTSSQVHSATRFDTSFHVVDWVRKILPARSWRRLSRVYWRLESEWRERGFRLKWAREVERSAIDWPWFAGPRDANLARVRRLALDEDWRRISTLEGRLFLLLLSVIWPVVAVVRCSRVLLREGRLLDQLPLRTQAGKIFWLAIRYNYSPAHYYRFRLFEQTGFDRCLRFFTSQDVTNILPAISGAEDRRQYDDKVLFARTARLLGLSVAAPLVGFKSGSLEAWWQPEERLPQVDLGTKTQGRHMGPRL